ncbi:MAG: hypothetical protein K2K74_02420 [Lachnospiraceae bacterium]|nr:hypothetical protein [Lachnospiraceae bacterium]
MAAAFLTQHFAGEEQLQCYMVAGPPDICARIENAAANINLDKIFVL